MTNPQLPPTFATDIEMVQRYLHQRVVGRDLVVRLALVTLACDGNLLLESLPGTAKTTLAQELARALGVDPERGDGFRRVNGTPDLLPVDITGTEMLHGGTLRFSPGPLFASFVLFDEINRATPRTQSALLQAMAERKVTIGNTTYDLPDPYFVIATQNPLESEGTYPLPDAQLDRFLVRARIGYVPDAQRAAMLKGWQPRFAPGSRKRSAGPLTLDQVQRWREEILRVRISDLVLKYLDHLVIASRERPELANGTTDRGALELRLVAQAWAASEGRWMVTPEDVQAIFEPVVAHRWTLTRDADVSSAAASSLAHDLLRTVPVPGGMGDMGGR